MTEAIELRRDCEVIAIPSGMRQILPKGEAVRIVQSRGANYTISSHIHATFLIDANDADALGFAVPGANNRTEKLAEFNESMV